ncbi:MAG: class II aldolase/adducin family protein [Bacillota bacterium]
MDQRELRKEMTRVCRTAYWRGLTAGAGGNASARVAEDGPVLIKRTGLSFLDVTPESFLLVSMEGEVLSGAGKPSTELGFHLALYREHPEIGAVFHGHPPFATALASQAGKPDPRESWTDVPVVPPAPPGSPELARGVAAAFRKAGVKCALLQDHGIVTVGRDIRDAFLVADHVENRARMEFLSRVLVL